MTGKHVEIIVYVFCKSYALNIWAIRVFIGLKRNTTTTNCPKCEVFSFSEFLNNFRDGGLFSQSVGNCLSDCIEKIDMLHVINKVEQRTVWKIDNSLCNNIFAITVFFSPPFCQFYRIVPKIVSLAKPRLVDTKIRGILERCQVVIPFLNSMVKYFSHDGAYFCRVFSFNTFCRFERLSVGNSIGATLACRVNVLTNALTYGNRIAIELL